MKKYEIFTLITLAIVIAIPIVLNLTVFDENGSPDDPPQEENGDSNSDGSNDGNDENNGDGEVVWGVDSASYTDDDMYSCVIDNFGEPEVWGRYLGDREGVSTGLDNDEVDFIHEHDIQILVIYNHVNDARGYDHGVEHGEQAIQYAKDLGVPEGVALFVDIEPDYPVDAEFMAGWYDTLSDSEYEPGIYGVFDEGSELDDSYNAMDEGVQESTVVWTAYPQEEVTTKENAPKYNPEGPDSAMLYGWQYAIDAETCNIDTNLFRSEMLDFLW
ncbi:glycoside hydrolase domain-containing protein [Ornithinibacillus salinisoli]|uniref:Glycoside hydrolase domain-containing protein n=1 Tax=Ornithinibacillus salinisoli TaxID=1848459 RepID=A0ABW4VWP6_9BACI